MSFGAAEDDYIVSIIPKAFPALRTAYAWRGRTARRAPTLVEVAATAILAGFAIIARTFFVVISTLKGVTLFDGADAVVCQLASVAVAVNV